MGALRSQIQRTTPEPLAEAHPQAFDPLRCRHGRLPTESADGHSGVGRQACAGTRGAVSMVVLIW